MLLQHIINKCFNCSVVIGDMSVCNVYVLKFVVSLISNNAH